MRFLSFLLICIVLCGQLSECLNVLSLDAHISLQKIKRDPFIQISINESLIDSDQQSNQIRNIQFFILKTVSRHKSKAYLRLLKNYQKLVNILIQKLVIGDEKLLIKSKIKQKFLRKKKLWEFGIMFMIQGQRAQIQETMHSISRLGVIKMNNKPKTSAISERMIASNAFYKLKQKILEQISRSEGLSIIKVGLSIPNTISLQKKVIQKALERLKLAKNDQMSFPTDYFFLKPEIHKQSKMLKLTVVFKIDYQSQIIQEESQQSQDSQYESQDSDSQSYEDDSDHCYGNNFQDQSV